MATPVVRLTINDTSYDGWLSVNVTTSIENLSGTFSLSLTDRWSGQDTAVVIKPTDSCTLSINGQIVITGYVDVVNLNLDANNHGITVTGRDKTADLIDCCVANGTGQYKNLTLSEIAKRLCAPFNIPVISAVDDGAIFPTFNVEQGATVYETLQKLCGARQCLAMSNGLGSLLITRAGDSEASTPLAQGINIKSGSAAYDNSLRFSQYICKGQLQGADTEEADEIAGNMAMSVDDGVIRYRPLVIVADGQASKADCQKRADWERSTRRGRSRRFSIVTAGWLQELGGDLWQLNQLVTLKSEALGVFDKLLIASINFTLDENGELTTLDLTSADSYLTSDFDVAPDADSNPYLQVEQ